jgi:hypothetical protein
MSKYDDFGQNFPRNYFGAFTTVAAVVVGFFLMGGGGGNWQNFATKK